MQWPQWGKKEEGEETSKAEPAAEAAVEDGEGFFTKTWDSVSY